ncbi:glycoside hydrolase family 47 protein [Sclerotinia borealis F-4128]|uniref:alpha-1,2-Mannosidase n=1 Tax=Sclerotinia borealis (strain F-4128) TaxID=1432307 RepID=W9CAZ4_SCLBF|nr:glycoside hydrolase family 47 protein [Sclerotinia borealis F-4128]
MTFRWKATTLVAAIFLLFLVYQRPALKRFQESYDRTQPIVESTPDEKGNKFRWSEVPHSFPVTDFIPLPTNPIATIPRIQHQFEKETQAEKAVRLSRLEAVKDNFTHAWNGYTSHAWLKDEVMPLSGGSMDPFGGWAASLVDTLDTLWIMGMHSEFKVAVEAIQTIDFSTCALDQINVFETTIRYLGGFLSAYELSGEKFPVLLQKATEMGEMLYKSFDTPNHLPILRWYYHVAATGAKQEAEDNVLESEIGSLTLEFTRLGQITGDPRYYDAVQRIMNVFDEQQASSKLPGMWPVVVNAKDKKFTDYGGFTIGGMADSLYEYLPKQHLLLGGATQQYRRMYEFAIIAMKRNIFYRPMTKNGEDVRLPGNVDSDGKTPVTELETQGEAQHLGCFAGGMVAIGAKIFENEKDLELARKLTEGCLWAYENMPLGIMPEKMHTVPCENETHCPWDEQKWLQGIDKDTEGNETVQQKIQQHRLIPGVTKPEAIESVFILYRITGDPKLRERAWTMFNNIIKHTITDIAHAALDDCTVSENPPKADRMESFWMAETLKYFYLIFADPDLISLDEYVLNTEAHPLRRPK